MGQIPKNNIIKAEAGATLRLKVNGVYKNISVEKADEMMANRADALIQSGELRASEKPAYMESWNGVKQKALEGEYSIDTAGKDTASNVQYTGPTNSLGMITNNKGESVASERSELGSRFTKKTRRGNMKDMEALVNREAFPAMGRISLEGDEADSIKATTDEAALKEKTDKATSDAKIAADAEAAHWNSPDYNKWFSGRFGNNADWQVALKDLPQNEKEQMMTDYVKSIVPDMLKYKSLADVGSDWMTPFKNPDSTINYGKDFNTAFFTRVHGGAGRAFANNMYNSMSTTLTPEQTTQRAIDEQESKLAIDHGLRTGNFIKVGDNAFESIGTSKMFKNDPNKKFRERFVKDSNGILQSQIVEDNSPEPESAISKLTPTLKDIVNKSTQSEAPSIIRPKEKVYQHTIDKITKKPLYINTENPNDMFSPDEVTDYIPKHYKGGLLIPIAQEGISTALDNLKKAAYRKKVDEPSALPGKSVENKKENSKSNSKQDTSNENSFKDMNWSESDILETSSLIADLGSTIASFVPGGNVFAAGAGLVGTGLAMRAEASRGELGWEDTGKYLASGALDAAALIPGIGVAAKMAKLERAAPTLINILTKGTKAGLLGAAVYGAKDIPDIISKIGKEGWGTLKPSDYRSILGALTLLGTSHNISANKKVRDTGILQETESDKVIGRMVDKTTGKATDAVLKKEGDAWVPEQPDLFKNHVIAQFKTPEGVAYPIGTKENIVSAVGKSSFGTKYDLKTGITTPGSYNPLQIVKNRRLRLTSEYDVKHNPEFIVSEPIAPAPKKSVVKVDETTPDATNLTKTSTEEPIVKTEEVIPEVTTTPVVAPTVVIPEEPTISVSNSPEVPISVPKTKISSEDQKRIKEAIEKRNNLRLSNLEARKKILTEKINTGDRTAANKRLGLSDEDVIFKNGGVLIPKGDNGLVVGKPNNWLSTLVAPPEQPTSVFGLMKPKPQTLLGNNTLSNIQATPLIPGQYQRTMGLTVTSPSTGIIGKTQDIKVGKPKDSTIFDQLNKSKLSEQGTLDVSELGRTLFLNKALEGQKPGFYMPQVTDKLETNVPIQGDLLTKGSFYNRAAQTRGLANANRTSDATANMARSLAANQQANDLETQGDLSYSQGIDRSRQMQMQSTDANNQARANTANERSMYFTKATQAQQEGNKAIEGQKASNLNTLWASRNFALKQDIAEKEGVSKSLALQQEQARVEASHPNALAGYYIYQRDPNNPANQTYLTEYNKYAEDLLNAKKKVYGINIQKSGGSIVRDKYNMKMYNEENKFKDDIVKVINKWTDKRGDVIRNDNIKTSKELNDLVSKIFSK